MGRRGPRPDPRSQRSQQRAIAIEPPPETLALSTIPPCPDAFDRAGAAADAWQRFARLTYESGTLTAADLPALELLCLTWAEYLAASEIADDPSLAYVLSEKGGIYPHPAVNRQSAARKQLCVLFARFGLTPLDRTNTGGPKGGKPTGSALGAFAAARNSHAGK